MFSGSMVALVTPFKNGERRLAKPRGVDRLSPAERDEWDRAVRYHGRVGDPKS